MIFEKGDEGINFLLSKSENINEEKITKDIIITLHIQL